MLGPVYTAMHCARLVPYMGCLVRVQCSDCLVCLSGLSVWFVVSGLSCLAPCPGRLPGFLVGLVCLGSLRPRQDLPRARPKARAPGRGPGPRLRPRTPGPGPEPRASGLGPAPGAGPRPRAGRMARGGAGGVGLVGSLVANASTNSFVANSSINHYDWYTFS